MNLSQQGAISALSFSLMALNGASLTFYSGTIPATPETALSGNTALATTTFSNPAVSALANSSGQEIATMSLTSSTITPSVGGVTTFARATITSSGAWSTSHTYAVGVIVTSNTRYYVCIMAGTSASSGGPGNSGSPTSLTIGDGTCGWSYIGSTASPIYCDFSVGQGAGADIVLGNTTLTTSNPVGINNFQIQQAAL